jgi:SAM-dependent methyltransferase
MIEKQKSINYWNSVAKEWKNMVYNTDKRATVFPSSQIREKIVVDEIKKVSNKDIKILDIGCADGSLVRKLIENGYNSVKGIDNSEKMIDEANHQLMKHNILTKDIFTVGDADNYVTDEKFDIVIAMGLIEYVNDLNDFFRRVSSFIKPNGKVFIESKNKLFNVFSANEYTVNSDIKELIDDIESIKGLSPKKIEDVVIDTFAYIGKKIKSISYEKSNESVNRYPFDLPQYSPKELISLLFLQGLITNSIIYYHCHPFPPKYRKDFSVLYDELSIMMQPLGYTHLGASICSSFVLIAKKS